MTKQENKFKLHKLVQLGIYSTVLEDFDLDYWLKMCYDLKKLEPKSATKSNRGGWHSRSDLHADKNFWPLVKNIQDKYYPIIDNPAHVLTGLWINISKYTNWNSPHNHVYFQDSYPYEKYSGVFYLKVPSDSGTINFQNPLNLNHWLEIAPEEKMMIIFPSALQHYVKPNQSQEDRISISFNIEDVKNNLFHS